MAGGTYTLAQVQADIITARSAINDIINNGQSRQMNGRVLTLADLGTLRDHLRWLLSEEARLQNSGNVKLKLGVPIK